MTKYLKRKKTKRKKKKEKERERKRERERKFGRAQQQTGNIDIKSIIRQNSIGYTRKCAVK